MSESDVDKQLNKLGKDVETIKLLLQMQARQTILKILGDIATTPERQQMWRLADGTVSNEKIAENAGVALRSVQYFMQEAENLGIIQMVKRGYPQRIENIIPVNWKAFKKSKKEVQSNTAQKNSEAIGPFTGSNTT